MSQVNYQRCRKKGGGADFSTAFSENLGNGGDRSPTPEQQEADNETVGNVGMWGVR